MATQQHLSLEERIQIQQMLSQSASFKQIGRELNRHCTTISKEIRHHMVFQKTGCMGQPFNDCANRRNCPQTRLCNNNSCTKKYCRSCSHCHLHCDEYYKEYCHKLNEPPYVCNGCSRRNKCTLEKHKYSAGFAQKEYEEVRSESRSGVCITETEAQQLDSLISPLLQKGQSIHHIYVHHRDTIMFSEKTIYNYIGAGLFSAKNIDLPRKVRYRPSGSLQVTR